MVKWARGFRPPTRAQSIRAIGAPPVARDLQPVDEFFEPLQLPVADNDWLAQYVEDGQTYDLFMRECPWISGRPRKFMNKMKFDGNGRTLVERYPKGKVYLLPVGRFSTQRTERIRLFVQSYYVSVPVMVLPALDIDDAEEADDDDRFHSCRYSRVTIAGTAVTCRFYRATKQDDEELAECVFRSHRQLQIDSLLTCLRQQLPADALCLLGITMEDIYDTKPDLFVAGMAAGASRVAVFSLLRYDPGLKFSGEHWYQLWEDSGWTDSVAASTATTVQTKKKAKTTSSSSSSTRRRRNNDVSHVTESQTESVELLRQRLLEQRSVKLLVHELGHLFGFDHCVFFQCIMNGSGHLEEDFRQPMHMCPVDLHKLKSLIGLDDLMPHYQQLLPLYREMGMMAEAEWVQRRIEFLQHMASSSSEAENTSATRKRKPATGSVSTATATVVVVDLTTNEEEEEEEEWMSLPLMERLKKWNRHS